MQGSLGNNKRGNISIRHMSGELNLFCHWSTGSYRKSSCTVFTAHKTISSLLLQISVRGTNSSFFLSDLPVYSWPLPMYQCVPCFILYLYWFSLTASPAYCCVLYKPYTLFLTVYSNVTEGVHYCGMKNNWHYIVS